MKLGECTVATVGWTGGTTMDNGCNIIGIKKKVVGAREAARAQKVCSASVAWHDCNNLSAKSYRSAGPVDP